MYFNSFKFETGFLPKVLLFWLFLWGAKPLRSHMNPAVLSTRKREFFSLSHNYFFWWLFRYTLWVEMNFCSGIRNMGLHLRAKLTASSPFYCLRNEERYKFVFSHSLMLRQLKLHSFLIANYWRLQTTIFHQVVLWKWSLWLKLWQTLCFFYESWLTSVFPLRRHPLNLLTPVSHLMSMSQCSYLWGESLAFSGWRKTL